MFDGTPVLVPAGFNTEPEPNGEILMYPEGDKSVPPSGRMPKNGWYFDSIIRQEPIDEDNLNPADNLEEFTPISEEDLAYYRQETEKLKQSRKGVVGSCGFALCLANAAAIPAPASHAEQQVR
jgi:hypothetical protein